MFRLYHGENKGIGGVIISVLASSVVHRGFYKICICCFSAKHAVLRSKSKEWLAWNQNNVSEWSDMFTRGLLLCPHQARKMSGHVFVC
jgi:hypothetical protein